ncbi:MAG TPA: SAM-dependent methyltransferase [Pyrinomonadaceae bacterium]|jgi:SAM-dependent MidA family methyltransferase|nr:SAM-dependent methyltransferase [Pyrinomonadaceae bacterium]
MMDQHNVSETGIAPDVGQSPETGQSSLAARLLLRIERQGPLTFRDWMEAVLYDPLEGYYQKPSRERWGRAGDYRTSPERSPLFAATFARYFATLYENLGEPNSWTIIEAGAGACHFARGVLQTLRRDYQKVFTATRYIIDEASEDARERARVTLAPFAGQVEYCRLSELTSPFEAGVVFSNELADAFPVHRVLMLDGHLRELRVGAEPRTGTFNWIPSEPSTARLSAYFESARIRLDEGQMAEVNLDAEDWLKTVANAIKRGYVITVDYGAEATELYSAPHRREGTLRALSHHRFAENVLAHPGEQDITTTVDWTNFKQAGLEHGLHTVSLEGQDQFLLRAGLLDQLESMTARAQSEADAMILRTSAREMILPGGMGSTFQVLVQKKQER